MEVGDVCSQDGGGGSRGQPTSDNETAPLARTDETIERGVVAVLRLAKDG
jgi:hypothetical protein